jgi:hypothetical protein
MIWLKYCSFANVIRTWKISNDEKARYLHINGIFSVLLLNLHKILSIKVTKILTFPHNTSACILRAMNVYLGIMIICLSGATCLPTVSCFHELALKIQLSILVWYKWDIIIILIAMKYLNFQVKEIDTRNYILCSRTHSSLY